MKKIDRIDQALKVAPTEIDDKQWKDKRFQLKLDYEIKRRQLKANGKFSCINDDLKGQMEKENNLTNKLPPSSNKQKKQSL